LPYISKIGRALNSWIKKANINKHITFHSGRHTYAVNSLTSGVDIFTVSKLLGHRDLKTTLVYAKIVDSKLNEAVNKLPVLMIS
jgi:site-specific recombinase XerD